MDLWRVRLKEIRGVVVRRPRGKMAEGLAAGEVWARVAILSRAGGRSVSGVYPYAVAMECGATRCRERVTGEGGGFWGGGG